ncbi:DUF4249 domain-containing protein [Tenacibaculum sp. M341]|uniref:DUF4249 domain-containing protein n=1 Tax=Tenacibaculum sp. M341 TaxID=2530339 RepID=UPI001044F1EC|nr:DUF4249 domain-containing protein [Tenacibaculum sp. M341]TCI95018.1 DUF4249 domain-containing protein [Tenacibaculum sp. M341]
MKLKKYKVWFYFILITSCIEPFDIENLSFEKNLVVNAVITNEFKHHMIELSNTVELNSDEVKFETDAKVSIVDSNQLVHRFIEVSAGKYESEEKFKAELNLEYKLIIETKDGQVYESTSEKLAEETSIIEQINTDVIQDNFETKVILSVDTKSFDDDQKFYRYEYVETYKVTPPFWRKYRIKTVLDTYPYEFDLELKDFDRFCYPTSASKKIILKGTTNLSESSIREFPVRSIPIEDIALSIRYSILVKQFSINQEVYNYYKLLEKFSISDNVFSQTQVGKIPSNIRSIDTKNKAVGYFHVASVFTKRIFFDRDKVTDTYYNNNTSGQCYNIFAPPVRARDGESPLLNLLREERYVYYGLSDEISVIQFAPYLVIPRECGDCRHLGPAEKPDFWID